jgi:hypothetical protein
VGGGHAPGTGRRATTEFPPAWSDEQIIAVVKDVANDPGEPRARQYNGRWRCAGERYGVQVVVLVDAEGFVHTGYPVTGLGVVRNPDASRDPANPTVADAAENRISYFLDSLLSLLADRFSPAELTHYRSLQWAGEWEELADALAAHVTVAELPLTPDELSDFEKLLNSFDLPVKDCLYINDRDHILNRLRG